MSTGQVHYDSGWTGPALGQFSVTNAAFATEDIITQDDLPPRAIYIGTAGDLVVDLVKPIPASGFPTQVDGGVAGTNTGYYKGVAAGTVLVIAVKKLYNRTTGNGTNITTAQDITFLF